MPQFLVHANVHVMLKKKESKGRASLHLLGPMCQSLFYGLYFYYSFLICVTRHSLFETEDFKELVQVFKTGETVAWGFEPVCLASKPAYHWCVASNYISFPLGEEVRPCKYTHW